MKSLQGLTAEQMNEIEGLSHDQALMKFAQNNIINAKRDLDEAISVALYNQKMTMVYKIKTAMEMLDDAYNQLELEK